MAEILLKAEHRSVLGKQVKALRRQGLLPAVLYGHGFESKPVQFDLRDATLGLSQAGSSTLVTILLDGEKHLALVREKQRNYLKGTLKHVDFQLVSMKEKIRVNIPLEFVGESNAVKNYNGIMVVNLNQVEVECLPQDLPTKITIDIVALKNIGDAITVANVRLPENVQVLTNTTEVVVVVTGQRAEEVAIEGAAVVEPEIVEKRKKEEGEAE
jgi:large subunit ribosomal protein L25